MNSFKRLKVLSVEQALALPYLTYRLALEGMEVLKVENPPTGDPNRSAGPKILEEEKMNGYFLPFNCAKRAVTLNLKKEEGKRILRDLIREWKVDIFACNLLPNKYKELGIDYETIRSVREAIIWLGLTGYGPEIPERAYDPIIQARTGILGVTGEEGQTPFVCGVPLGDISASENGYGQVMKALYEREVTGKGSRIDISLFFSALSYQIVHVTMIRSFGIPIERTGNNQRFFAPASVYRTGDGFVYMALGSDAQFENLSGIPGFESLARPEFKTNPSRLQHRARLDDEINQIMTNMTSEQVTGLLGQHTIPIAKVFDIEDVASDSLVESKMMKAVDPRTGLELIISPPPNETPYVFSTNRNLPFAPRLGEHNEAIYGKILGYSDEKLREFHEKRII